MSPAEPEGSPSSREDDLLTRMLPYRWEVLQQSWGAWGLLLLLALFLAGRGELDWSFLALWSVLLSTAPVISHHALDGMVPAGVMLMASIPFLTHCLGAVMGLTSISSGILGNAVFALACYSVAYLSFISLGRVTGLRLNWALLNLSVVFLAVCLCSFTLIVRFLSDQYFATEYLAGDNIIVMVELSWALIGSILVGWFVTKVIGPSPAIYEPFVQEHPEGEK